MSIPGSHVKVARVLSEDAEWVTLEVAKEDTTKFTLDADGTDRFLTLVFIRNTLEESEGKPVMETWLPWEDTDA